MRRLTNTNFLFWIYIPKPEWYIALRHLLNAKTPFMSWQRSSINKVKDWALHIKTFFLYINYRHISTIHTDQKEIKCHICDKALLNTASLNAHIKRVHEKITKFSCDICEKTFYQSCQLQTHKRFAHEGQRDFECDFCDRAYSTLGNLKKHIQNIHDGMKIHKCNLCSKARYLFFTQKSSYKIHTD